MKPRLIVQQKITAFVNKYEIYSINSDGGKGDLIAFAQQRRLAIKEKIEFYSDEVKTEKLFSFRAEKVMDVHGRYFIEDGDDKRIGAFKKQFAKSLLNSTWDIIDNGDVSVLTISESNRTLAALRRFAGFIPFVGDLFEIVLLFFKYHFTFSKAGTTEEVGRYTKTTLFRDHYQLDMTDEEYEKHDWRVLAAMSVGLDALQSR